MMRKHCCEMMTNNVELTCDVHVDRYTCPDCLIDYQPVSRRYGIIIHDGGESTITITYYPWCGIKLPEKSDWGRPLKT